MLGEKRVDWLGVEVLGEDDRRHAAAHAHGVPFVVLSRSDISIDALVLIPEPLSRTRNIVAYALANGVVEVAVLDLNDVPAIDFLREKNKVNVRLTDRGSIKNALLIYQKHLKEKFAGMVESGIEAADSLLRHALHSNAAYVHLEPSYAGMVVRYRINGALQEAMRLPEQAGAFIAERLKSLAKLFGVTTAAQSGKFKIEHNNQTYSVGVSTVPTAKGEKIVMRLASETAGAGGFTLHALGFHGESLEQVQEVLHAGSGLIVVAGPRLSGKTTTLYTLLDHFNAASLSLATVEEQVEYSVPRAHQTVVRADIGFTAPAALRAVLKQDPDVVLVGNMEDEDTTQVALSAAKRGVLVLAGVKARSGFKALETIRAHSNNSLTIASSVRAVISQDLLPKLCEHTKQEYKLTREQTTQLESKAEIGRVLAALKKDGVLHDHVAWKDIVFYVDTPCDECKDASAKIGIQEVFLVTPAIKELLRTEALMSQIETAVREEGGLNLVEDSLYKAALGLVSIEAVFEQ